MAMQGSIKRTVLLLPIPDYVQEKDWILQ
jgi:hypothetical protein